MTCPFCEKIRTGEILLEAEGSVAFADAHPVSQGHTLVVPRRHVPLYFDLSADEQAGLWRLVAEIRKTIDTAHSPQGYNVGVNVGRAAGQTVDHTHIHLIPRYKDDTDDPRGGIRWVRPDRADYWTAGG